MAKPIKPKIQFIDLTRSNNIFFKIYFVSKYKI